MELSSALADWVAAMDAQTEHEALCDPCLLNGVPVCGEGRMLQNLARQAHEAWVSEQYAGRAVA